MYHSNNGYCYSGRIPISYGAMVFLNGRQVYKDEMIPKIAFFDFNLTFSYDNNYHCSIKGEEVYFKNIRSKRKIDKYIVETKRIHHKTFKLYGTGYYGAPYLTQIIYPEVYKIVISYLENQLTVIYGTYINPNWETWGVDTNVFGSFGFRKVLNGIAMALNISMSDLERIRAENRK